MVAYNRSTGTGYLWNTSNGNYVACTSSTSCTTSTVQCQNCGNGNTNPGTFTVHNVQNLILRSKRIQGQFEAFERVLDEGRDCSEVLQIISAARGAVNSLMTEPLEGHIWRHVLDPKRKPNSEQTIAADEVIDMVKTYLRGGGYTEHPTLFIDWPACQSRSPSVRSRSSTASRSASTECSGTLTPCESGWSPGSEPN